MASYNSVLFMFALFLATICAAPADDADALIKVPSECKGQAFCHVKPEGYDKLEERINSLIPPFLIEEIRDRYAVRRPKLSPKDDWHNCPYVTQFQPMYMYYNENDTKVDIIVQTNLISQYVEIVSCATEHINTGSSEQCFQDLGGTAFKLSSTCVTTKAKRTLLVYDEERHKVIQKSYDIPACCRCQVNYSS